MFLDCLASRAFDIGVCMKVAPSVSRQHCCVCQVSQNRLTWPGLLEHPFVRETSDELAARVSMIEHMTDSFDYGGISVNCGGETPSL